MNNIEAFSQLPFIRRSGNMERGKNSNHIRLFGIEFPHETEQLKDSSSSKHKNSSNGAGGGNNGDSEACGRNKGASGEEMNNRKFECHYCCRKFPTSQALGGHQNAHKRERQQLKSAHFQSVHAAHYRQPHHGGTDGYLYGQPNSVPSSTRFGFDHYPSWNYTVTASCGATTHPTPQFYCDGVGTVLQPINESPVSGLWRSSRRQVGYEWESSGLMHRSEHYLNSAPHPLVGNESTQMGGSHVHGGRISSPSQTCSFPMSSQTYLRVGESATVGVRQEHVSLNLHL